MIVKKQLITVDICYSLIVLVSVEGFDYYQDAVDVVRELFSKQQSTSNTPPPERCSAEQYFGDSLRVGYRS